MIAFEDAQRLVLEKAVRGTRTMTVPVVDAVGLVAAEDVISRVEMPRFNRAAMDGFAVRHEEVDTERAFKVAATVAAGESGEVSVGEGECVRIMTGAPVPEGLDTVIPFEDAFSDGQVVRFQSMPQRGANVARRGEDIAEGAVAVEEGTLIRPREVSVLAAVGRTEVRVFEPPTAAVLVTGEEIVDAPGELSSGRIWNSNGPAMAAYLKAEGARVIDLGIAGDTKDALEAALAHGLEEADVVVVSGGVSAGDYDLVPGVLESLGVERIFHGIMVKPGKPTFFGRKGERLVFGLAGNPVSVLFALDQMVIPAVRVFKHHPQPVSPRMQGELTETVRKKTGRLLLLPCLCEWRRDRFLLTPVRTHGSADIFSLGEAGAIAYIAAGVERVEKGSAVPFRMLYGRL